MIFTQSFVGYTGEGRGDHFRGRDALCTCHEKSAHRRRYHFFFFFTTLGTCRINSVSVSRGRFNGCASRRDPKTTALNNDYRDHHPTPDSLSQNPLIQDTWFVTIRSVSTEYDLLCTLDSASVGETKFA